MTEERKFKILLIAGKDFPLLDELDQAGFEVCIVESYGRYDMVMSELDRLKPDLVIVTNNSLMPPMILEVIPKIKYVYPGMNILVVAGCLDLAFAINLKKLGVDDCMPLPYDLDEVLTGINRILDRH
jgi:DNA-binding response OmpR family regulator